MELIPPKVHSTPADILFLWMKDSEIMLVPFHSIGTCNSISAYDSFPNEIILIIPIQM